MTARHSNPSSNVQAISSRLWSSGFLSSEHAGVALRSVGDPVLYLQNPAGVDQDARRAMLKGVQRLNELTYDELGDPETNARIHQFEMAFRMQQSVPEDRPRAEPRTRGPSWAGGRQARDVAYCAHGPPLPSAACASCRSTTAAGIRTATCRGTSRHAATRPARWGLVKFEAARTLEDTPVIWGGVRKDRLLSGRLTREDYGRDHHPRCFRSGSRAPAFAAASSTRDGRNSPTTSTRTRCTCAISPRPPRPVRFRPRALQLQVQPDQRRPASSRRAWCGKGVDAADATERVSELGEVELNLALVARDDFGRNPQ
jgi:hypothetical protein